MTAKQLKRLSKGTRRVRGVLKEFHKKGHFRENLPDFNFTNKKKMFSGKIEKVNFAKGKDVFEGKQQKANFQKEKLKFTPLKPPDLEKELKWEKAKAQTDARLRREAEWCDFFVVGGATTVQSSFCSLWNHPEPEWEQKWREATKKEFNTLSIEKSCWEKTLANDPSISKKPMRGRWVFAIKHGKEGEFTKCKARHCICGHAQEHFGKSYSLLQSEKCQLG
jgi:hypothetical protein